MSEQFKIVDAFEVRDSTILALDQSWLGRLHGKTVCEVDGERMTFTLTHNENWIVVSGSHPLKGKTVQFVD